MSWRIIAAVLIFIVSMIAIQPLVGPALFETTEQINATGDYDTEYLDGNSAIVDMPKTLLRVITLAIFGIMAWGAVRVVRKERFRGRR